MESDRSNLSVSAESPVRRTLRLRRLDACFCAAFLKMATQLQLTYY
jgi:hypothetical protein